MTSDAGEVLRNGARSKAFLLSFWALKIKLECWWSFERRNIFKYSVDYPFDYIFNSVYRLNILRDFFIICRTQVQLASPTDQRTLINWFLQLMQILYK